MGITSAVYGGGPFYPGSGSVLGTLNQTGFTTIICWSVHVNANGDLVYNNTPIVSGGKYIGDLTWSSQLDKLKSGGSVNRILFSVGAGGTSDFTNIMNLIQKYGTGSSSILNQNFTALLNAIPSIDGIDMDDEDNLDQNTIVSFSQMLAAIGYKEVTFCPYYNSSFWINCLVELNNSNRGLVTAFNLQCYSGGAGNIGNVVSGWIQPLEQAMPYGFDAAAFVNPGLWCTHGSGCSEGMDASTIQSNFTGWKNDGIKGGFIWLYDDIIKCGNDPNSYADAIHNGLT